MPNYTLREDVFATLLPQLPTTTGIYRLTIDLDYYYLNTCGNLQTSVRSDLNALMVNRHNNERLQSLYSSESVIEVSFTPDNRSLKDRTNHVNQLLKESVDDEYLLNYRDLAGNPLNFEEGHPNRIASLRLKIPKKAYNISESELQEVCEHDNVDFETAKANYLASGKKFKIGKPSSLELLLTKESQDLLKDPSIKGQPGVYYLRLGDLFYIGSALNLPKRIGQHTLKFHKGIHETKRLQDYLNANPGSRFTINFKPFSGTEEELRQFEKDEILNHIDDLGICNLLTPDLQKLPIGTNHPNFVYLAQRQFGFGSATDEELAALASHWGRSVENLKAELETRRQKTILKASKAARVAVKIDDVVYPSIGDAASALNVSQDTIRIRINRADHPNYEYLNPDRVESLRGATQNSKTLLINGKEYASISEASFATGLGRQTIAARLDDHDNKEYQYK